MAEQLDDIYKKRNEFFKQRRGEAEQGARAAGQETQDAIMRRFAALNQTGSGAQISAITKANELQDQQRRAALQDVNAQELQMQEGDVNRAFQSQEGKSEREFQGGLSRELAAQDLAFKTKLADVEQANKLKEMDLIERQFGLEQDVTAFNKRMAELESRRGSPGIFGSLFGSGGLVKDIGSIFKGSK